MKPAKKIAYKRIKPIKVKHKFIKFLMERIRFAYITIREMEDNEYGGF